MPLLFRTLFRRKVMKNHLADKRQVVLILRLTIDGRGHFMHGEVVDLDGKPIGRYVEWPKLTDLVRVWLARQEEDDKSNSLSNRE